MRPLTFPCGCEFTLIVDGRLKDTIVHGELWESELCQFHEDVMSEYLKETS